MSGEGRLDGIEPDFGMGVAFTVEASKAQTPVTGIDVEVSSPGRESSFILVIALLGIVIALHASIGEDLEHVLHGQAVEVVGEGEAVGGDVGIRSEGHLVSLF